MLDVWVMLGFGIVGYLMQTAKVSTGPFVIGYILAPIAEVQLRSGLMLYDESYLPLITHPVSLAFIIITFLTMLWPFFTNPNLDKNKSEELTK